MSNTDKKNNKSYIKQTLCYYWDHSRPYKVHLFLALFATIVSPLVSVVSPVIVRNIIDAMSGARDVIDYGVVYKLVAEFAVVSFVGWFGWRYMSYALSRAESFGMADLTRTCFNYIHKHSFTYFNNNFVGSLVKKVNRFVGAYETVLDRIYFNFLPTVIYISTILGILFYKNIWLGVGMLVWLLVFSAIVTQFVKYRISTDIERGEADSVVSGVLADTFTNHQFVKIWNGFEREKGFFSQKVDILNNLRYKSWIMSTKLFGAISFVGLLLQVIMIYGSIVLFRKGSLSVGDIVMLQSFVILITGRVFDIGHLISRTFEAITDAAEMTEVLQTPHEIVDAPKAGKLKVNDGKIVFEDVVFSYIEGGDVLNGVNINFEAGKKIALVGPSGAGKSTIVKLLLRMHNLTGGQILIDGQDIAKVTLESLWQNIGFVPQDPILFHRSLLENIRYGRPNATDEEVKEAAKSANAHDFISSFQDGYNTLVGERGVKLSGGERQRIAIARAILRNAPILILDEATSSLDSESEREIQTALERLMRGKTSIVIAHRLSTIMKMDEILVMDAGQIVEQGTHAELTTKRGGLYAKLWSLQAGGFIK